ncbi:MAG: DUF4402 domain-containing protein [Ignavibacteriae bacterium]|nr:DUF4402 domain-containing protein [Ignavibacteriota bacterium]
MKKLVLAIVTLVVLVLTQDVFSQQVAETENINAKGTVITHISVTAHRDLDFGTDIVPGVAKTVDKAATNSGKFTLAGEKSRQIAITFTLPSNLSSGTNLMPITFTTTDAGYQNSVSPMTAFNPAVVQNASFSSTGTMEVYLGGKVTPSSSQASGVYTAPVTISLLYTTN